MPGADTYGWTLGSQLLAVFGRMWTLCRWPRTRGVGYREWTLRFYSPDLLSVRPRFYGDVGKQLDAPAATAFSRHECCRAFSVPSDCGQNWMLCPQTESQKSNILIMLCHWQFGHNLEKNSSSAAFFGVWFLSYLFFSVWQIHFQMQPALAVILASCSEGRHSIRAGTCLLSSVQKVSLCVFACICVHH